jgi:hypothetical protein
MDSFKNAILKVKDYGRPAEKLRMMLKHYIKMVNLSRHYHCIKTCGNNIKMNVMSGLDFIIALLL